MKIYLVKKTATKAREGINSLTGKPTVFKAKLARKAVRIRSLKKLKNIIQLTLLLPAVKGVELLKSQWNSQIQLAAQKYGQLFLLTKNLLLSIMTTPTPYHEKKRLQKRHF